MVSEAQAAFFKRTQLIDMTGRTCGGWRVLHKMPAPWPSRGSVWMCQHTCKGNEGEQRRILGTQLRSKPPQFCNVCRPNNRTGRPRKYRLS